MKTLVRRLKGAFGNALIWGAAWAAASGAFWGGVVLFGVVSFPIEAFGLWLTAVSVSSGVSGVFTGLLFSLYLGVVHRDSSVLDLSVVRSAIVGSAIAAGVPILLNLVWLASIDFAIAPIGMLIAGASTPAVMGALTAGGTVYAARLSAIESQAEAAKILEVEQEGVDALLG